MNECNFTPRELKKILVLQAVLDKKITGKMAGEILGLSDRQVRTLKKRLRDEGPLGIMHRNKFNKPAHAFSDDFKKRIIDLKQSDKYVDTSFYHFRNLLEEKENIKISYPSLYRILTNNGICSKLAHR